MFRTVTSVLLCVFYLFFGFCSADDPYVFYDWNVSYITASPLGVEQQVIAINGQFPGPIVNVTTNNNLVVNVLNNLDEPLLFTWNGIQQRRNSWQDGVLGTNCPIPPRWNWTYQFQLKDQIGSFFYFPSLNFQRAAGGYGGFVLHNRLVIPVPFDKPDGDITLLIGDWYNRNHTALRKALDNGEELGMPDGVLMNGKGPYPYNSTLVPAGIDYETINVQPGKTYRIRVHHVGISTSLNFRIQNHNLLLVETEGSYTMKQNISSLDIHVGQSYSFLVTMDQNASSDYYIVASARFVNESLWTRVTGVAILHYSNSMGKATGPLPKPPDDYYYKAFSMNQARFIRRNLSTGAARPNPQGSFMYGRINVTDTYVLKNMPPVVIDGKRRTTFNGISYSAPETPLRLADQFKLTGIYKIDFPTRTFVQPPRIGTSIINGTYKGFLEIIFQNNDTTVQSFHMDGYAFFVVGMDYGNWTENERHQYNNWDAVSRSTTQVFPGAWTAVLVALDNVGLWNIRAANLDTWYLGTETYMKIYNPETTNRTELPLPDNVLYCGALASKQKQQDHGTSAAPVAGRRLKVFALMLLFAAMSILS
ncbi:hypothetical protein MRB53_003069 [Persea americana]|uniref:Uncharacterized protein n=1 Tax=Persea americana TaxID=3435 RepID=A0ACC2MXC0_PERAE|nr:hypothetical protein MRB53_003069 [Persea americana]